MATTYTTNGVISRSGYSNNDFPLTVSVTETATNATNNTSTLSISCKLSAPDKLTTTAWNVSSNVPTLKLFWHNVSTNTDTQIGNTLNVPKLSKGDSFTIKNESFVVTHQSDGTSKGWAYAVWNNTNSSDAVPGSKTITVPNGASATNCIALTNLERAAVLKVDKTNISISSSSGTAVTLTWASSGLYCIATAAIGSTAVTVSNSTASGATISNSNILKVLTKASTGTLTITLTTKTSSSGSVVGTSVKTCQVSIANSIGPAASISSITPVTNVLGTKLIGGKTKAKATVTATAQYNATISSVSATADNGNKITTSAGTATRTFNTDTLVNAASDYTLKITGTVKDSRGKIVTAESTATVYAYKPPEITLTLSRCTSSGAASASGAFVSIAYSTSIASIGSSNSIKTVSLKYKVTGGTEQTINTNNAASYSTGSTPIAVPLDKGITVTATITDAVGGSGSDIERVNAKAIPLSLHSDSSGGSLGVGIGTIAQANRFDVAMYMYTTGPIYTGGRTNAADKEVGVYIGGSAGTLYAAGSVSSGGKTAWNDGHAGTILANNGEIYVGTASADSPRNPAIYFYRNGSASSTAFIANYANYLTMSINSKELSLSSSGSLYTPGDVYTHGYNSARKNVTGDILGLAGRIYMCGTTTTRPGIQFYQVDPNPSDPDNPQNIYLGGLWAYEKKNADLLPASNESYVLHTTGAINATNGIFWGKNPVARSKTTNNVLFEWNGSKVRVWIDQTAIGYLTLS